MIYDRIKDSYYGEDKKNGLKGYFRYYDYDPSKIYSFKGTTFDEKISLKIKRMCVEGFANDCFYENDKPIYTWNNNLIEFVESIGKNETYPLLSNYHKIGKKRIEIQKVVDKKNFKIRGKYYDEEGVLRFTGLMKLEGSNINYIEGKGYSENGVKGNILNDEIISTDFVLFENDKFDIMVKGEPYAINKVGRVINIQTGEDNRSIHTLGSNKLFKYGNYTVELLENNNALINDSIKAKNENYKIESIIYDQVTPSGVFCKVLNNGNIMNSDGEILVEKLGDLQFKVYHKDFMPDFFKEGVSCIEFKLEADYTIIGDIIINNSEILTFDSSLKTKEVEHCYEETERIEKEYWWQSDYEKPTGKKIFEKRIEVVQEKKTYFPYHKLSGFTINLLEGGFKNDSFRY